MTDIEQKALALVNEVRTERNARALLTAIERQDLSTHEALCRAIEAHEATKQELSDFKQEVSDTIQAMLAKDGASVQRTSMVMMRLPTTTDKATGTTIIVCV